ncbi:Alpha-galactosidase [Forsythia ovata]|uniref:Alpha-galactosidase n=1 Tax=Forsythia ovata TaxID=205694 RepID=A0ABD1T7N6_9LAMI
MEEKAFDRLHTVVNVGSVLVTVGSVAAATVCRIMLETSLYSFARAQELASLVPEFRPTFYFSNELVPRPVGINSQVTIEEIQENAQGEEGEETRVINEANSAQWRARKEQLNLCVELKLYNVWYGFEISIEYTHVWAGPLSGDSLAVALRNRCSKSATITAKWDALALDSSTTVSVRDLWKLYYMR